MYQKEITFTSQDEIEESNVESASSEVTDDVGEEPSRYMSCHHGMNRMPAARYQRRKIVLLVTKPSVYTHC